MTASTYNPHVSANSDTPAVDDLIGSWIGLIGQKFTMANATVIDRGTVVGLNGSSEALKSLSAAGDGSQTPFGICAQTTTATDTEVLVFVHGSFNAREVERHLGTAHTIASIREGLRAKGIYLEWPVRRYPDV
jgi:hypothetical protein